jgi:hypothetical protein
MAAQSHQRQQTALGLRIGELNASFHVQSKIKERSHGSGYFSAAS